MTDIHRADCACDRCIQQLADAILGNLDKPSRLPAEMRFRPMSDTPEERQTEWHFSNGTKLVFKGEPAPYVGMPEPLIMDFGEEPTIIEETPAGLREKLDAVNARLAAIEKEEKERAIERAKRALDRLEEKTAGEFRLLGVDEMVGADGTTAAVDRALAALDTDYEAMGYPETGVGVDDLESKANVALAGVRAAVSCIEANVILYAWQPPEENNEAR